MLVYKVNNKVVASGYEQRGWSMIHGCPIPTGHVCMMVTSVQGDHVPPCILGDPSENGKLFNGGFFAFPVEALSLVTMNPDGSVRVRPYNSWIFKVPMKWKIKLLKNKLIERAFQSKEGWRFSFGDIFFISRVIQVSSNLQIRYWWRHKMCLWGLKHKTKLISGKNEAMQSKLCMVS